MEHQVDLLAVKNQVIAVATDVAQFIQQEIGVISQDDIKDKSLNSLVTYVDETAEKKIVSQLKAILPATSFLTEEATIQQEQSDWQWIIDPLDGTTNFIHQVPIFAISIALAYQHKIQIGVVYEVNKNECFHAIKNGGSYLNKNKINISPTTKLQDALMATGFPYYDYNLLSSYIEVLKYLMQNTRGIRRLGAAAVDLCYTACGRFDAFFEYSLSPWDVAAGSLILEEAGGKISDFNGGENWLYGKQILGSNPYLFNEVQQLIKSYF